MALCVGVGAFDSLRYRRVFLRVVLPQIEALMSVCCGEVIQD